MPCQLPQAAACQLLCIQIPAAAAIGGEDQRPAIGAPVWLAVACARRGDAPQTSSVRLDEVDAGSAGLVAGECDLRAIGRPGGRLGDGEEGRQAGFAVAQQVIDDNFAAILQQLGQSQPRAIGRKSRLCQNVGGQAPLQVMRQVVHDDDGQARFQGHIGRQRRGKCRRQQKTQRNRQQRQPKQRRAQLQIAAAHGEAMGKCRRFR